MNVAARIGVTSTTDTTDTTCIPCFNDNITCKSYIMSRDPWRGRQKTTSFGNENGSGIIINGSIGNRKSLVPRTGERCGIATRQPTSITSVIVI